MSGYGTYLNLVIVGLILIICRGPQLTAQEMVVPPSEDTLYQRLIYLDSIVKEMDKKLSERETEDELDALIKEAERLSSQQEEHDVDLSRKYFSGVRQQQGLNPNISFGMDFFGSVSSSDASSVSDVSDISYGNNGFFLREAQLSLIAPLDPFTRGKAFLSASSSGFEVDEVYLEWLNLPLQMNLKAGIFKPEFGLLNRYHDHALPQFDRPVALVNLFGTEGLVGSGIAANFLLPPFMAHASSLDLSMTYGSNPLSFRSDSTSGMMFTAQWLNYYDLSSSTYIEFRFSGVAGKKDGYEGIYNSYAGSAGMTLKWAPVGREKYRTLEWKTEYLIGFQDQEGDQKQSNGFYSSLRGKLGVRFWIGGRVGYSELPDDPSQSTWEFVFNVDFWQSEFVATRLQYQYNYRDMISRPGIPGPYPSDHSLVIQVNWAMGPHKHEAY
jgi:hypothetical protein